MNGPSDTKRPGDPPAARSFRFRIGSELVLEVGVVFAFPDEQADVEGAGIPSAELVVSGELCQISAPTFEEAVSQLIGHQLRVVTADLSGLELCTSSGVAALDHARIRLAAQAASLQLRGATGVVARVLDICGVPHDAPSSDALTASLQAPPASHDSSGRTGLML